MCSSKCVIGHSLPLGPSHCRAREVFAPALKQNETPSSHRHRQWVHLARVRSPYKAPIGSKIAGDQIVRAPGTAYVHLGCGGAYQVPVGIERVEKARLVVTGIGLNSLQRFFIDEKRCLNGAIVSPESYGTPRAVV